MVSLNLTLLVELVLFLFFYAVARRFVLVPLHRFIIQREERIKRDQEHAQKYKQDVERLREHVADQLAQAQQRGTQRLRDARFSAYRQNRIEADERRQQAESEVAAFHARVQGEVERERARYADVMPELVDAIDRQINIEGSLL